MTPDDTVYETCGIFWGDKDLQEIWHTSDPHTVLTFCRRLSYGITCSHHPECAGVRFGVVDDLMAVPVADGPPRLYSRLLWQVPIPVGPSLRPVTDTQGLLLGFDVHPAHPPLPKRE